MRSSITCIVELRFWDFILFMRTTEEYRVAIVAWCLLEVTHKSMLKHQLILYRFPASLISTWVDHALLGPTAAITPQLAQLSLTPSFFYVYLPEFCPENFAG